MTSRNNLERFCCRSPHSSEMKHQLMYKMATPPWKESYRKRCKDRLAKNRQNFLEKLRNCGGNDDDITASLKEILITECKDECNNYPDIDEDIDDILTMFEQINAELLSEEHEILTQYKQYKELDEKELMCDIYSSNDNINAAGCSSCSCGNDSSCNHSKSAVLCPMCQRNFLSVTYGVVNCECGMRIDTEQDAVTLDMIQTNLTHALNEHSSTCHDRALFNIFQQQTVSNLLMSCKSCDFLYIII